MKLDRNLRKKIILLIFFFMPGGFLLLSIMVFFNGILDGKNKNEDEEFK